MKEEKPWRWKLVASHQLPFGSHPDLTGGKESWGKAEAWSWPPAWPRWWQMERVQKQDFVGREAGMPKSPP